MLAWLRLSSVQSPVIATSITLTSEQLTPGLPRLDDWTYFNYFNFWILRKVQLFSQNIRKTGLTC